MQRRRPYFRSPLHEEVLPKPPDEDEVLLREIELKFLGENGTWVTAGGKKIQIIEMDDSHLLNAILRTRALGGRGEKYAELVAEWERRYPPEEEP
jgi:hypothetical protein